MASATKREPTFDLDDFDQPKQIDAPLSWMYDIIYLTFYEKGTFHDSPDIGVNITTQYYDTTEDAVKIIRKELTTQVSKYLSDIPIKEINVSSHYWEEKGVDIIVIEVSFSVNDELITAAAYVSLIDETLTYVIQVLGAL